MEMTELTMPQLNRLASAYMDGDRKVLSLFDYHHQNTQDFSLRLNELNGREFPREALADVLLSYNESFNPSQAVLDHIEQLRQPDSVAVVGGQQAGVLTGPLLTIHKCLSIIRLAKQQEGRLGVPVIPVFWIAGEDHDFEEINHTYVLRNGHPRKVSVPVFQTEKKSASAMALEKEKIKAWTEEVIASFGESEHTAVVAGLLNESLEKSETFTDWFAFLLMHLFKDEGLVLVDSGDPGLRALEKPFFKKMIRQNEELNRAVLQQIDQLHEIGFEETIEVDENSANLFYYVDGERVLLERDVEGYFRGKNNECLLSVDEMIAEAENHPERLSNNVVTRPLMQESLFPTLAFVGGPGEIAYWSTLKQAFHLFGYKVPLLMPRLNITLVDRQTEKWLSEQGVSTEQALMNGVNREKERWLADRKEWDAAGEAELVKQEIDHVHERMRSLAVKVDSHLEEIGRKNIGHLFNQIDYFTQQIERVYKGRYERELAKFDAIEAWLLPKAAPQERIWSVFPFLNLYGMDLVKRLAKQPFEFNGKHKVIYL